MDLKAHIRHVPDYPKPGILFYDITTLLREPEGYRAAVESLATPFEGAGIEAVVGIESRGFILGAAVAERLRTGFVPIRKPGKLPSQTIREAYALEYGTDALEMHVDELGPGRRTLIVDDVLATGGTAEAAVKLVKAVGASLCGLAFLIELTFLSGKGKLGTEHVHSVLQY
jgi:adenine phosphoribosyltransferase